MRRLGYYAVLALIAIAFSTTAFAQYSQPVRDVENPARTPYWGSGSGTASPGLANALFNVGAAVPSGQRLVIEQVGIRCMMTAADNIAFASVNAIQKTGGGWSSYSVPIVAQKQGVDSFSLNTAWVGSQQVRIYFDGVGERVQINVFRGNAADPMTCYATVIGYTIVL